MCADLESNSDLLPRGQGSTTEPRYLVRLVIFKTTPPSKPQIPMGVQVVFHDPFVCIWTGTTCFNDWSFLEIFISIRITSRSHSSPFSDFSEPFSDGTFFRWTLELGSHSPQTLPWRVDWNSWKLPTIVGLTSYRAALADLALQVALQAIRCCPLQGGRGSRSTQLIPRLLERTNSHTSVV